MAKIAIQTSSGLKATEGLSLGVSSVQNNGATAATAPVLLTLQSDGTLNAEGLAKAICAIATSFTEVEGRYIVNAVEQALVEIVTNCQYPTNVQLGFATFLWEVAGSLEAADAPANPLTNVPFMTGLVPERYRKVFASYDTYVPTTDLPCILKRIRDKATNTATIHGTNTFYLEGRGLTYGGTGEKVELWNSRGGKVCDVTVSKHDSMILFECAIPANPSEEIEVGQYYWIKITTLAGGGSAGGTLYTSDLKVEFAEGVTPEA